MFDSIEKSDLKFEPEDHFVMESVKNETKK